MPGRPYRVRSGDGLMVSDSVGLRDRGSKLSIMARGSVA